MALLDDINRLLRDHVGYTGDGEGGNGALPVGDRSTLRHFPDMRTWREILTLIAQTQGDPSALQSILTQVAAKADIANSGKTFVSRAAAEAFGQQNLPSSLGQIETREGNYLVVRSSGATSDDPLFDTAPRWGVVLRVPNDALLAGKADLANSGKTFVSRASAVSAGQAALPASLGMMMTREGDYLAIRSPSAAADDPLFDTAPGWGVVLRVPNDALLNDKADIASLLNVASEVARKANTEDVPLVDGAFGRGDQEAGFGLRFLDEAGRIAGGFDESGNPEFVWFGSFGRGDADQRKGFSIITGDDRQIDVGGEGASGWTPVDIHTSEPRDTPTIPVVWRDGTTLRVRSAIPEIYTKPRTQWFTDLASLYALYDDLMVAHPDYVTRTSLGQDGIGNPIYQYEFTPPLPLLTQPHQGDVLTPEAVASPKVIILSGVHGGERTAQMGTYMFAHLLCNGWREREEYARLRLGARLVIIPAATPSAVDTAERTNHNGVDINRNYAWRWSEVIWNTPGSPFYRGPSAASEAETQILQGLPTLHSDAVGIIDRHDHGDSNYLWWIANAVPAAQSAVNRATEKLAHDVYRLGISPDHPPTQTSAWLSGAIPGNGIGFWGAAGIPAMFVEQPNTAASPFLGGSTLALHRAAETLTQRMVTALIDHHLNGA